LVETGVLVGAPGAYRLAQALPTIHLGLGTLYATTGQRQQARAALSAAIVLYQAMDMTFWLPRTEAALAQVGACDNAAARTRAIFSSTRPEL